MGVIAGNGIDDSHDKSLEDYLFQLGRLYKSGVTSSESPSFLADNGGVLALAATDAPDVRFGKLMGFIDWQRDPSESYRAATARWKLHAESIAALARRQNWSPERAAQAYVRAYAIGGGAIQSSETVGQMMTLSSGESGNRPSWLYQIASDREKISEEFEIMTDPMPGIVTGAVEMATGDWEKAFEWGRRTRMISDPLMATEGHGRYEPEPPRGWKRSVVKHATRATKRTETEQRAQKRSPESQATNGGRPKSSERGTGAERELARRGGSTTTEPVHSRTTDHSGNLERPWIDLPRFAHAASEEPAVGGGSPEPSPRGGKVTTPRRAVDVYVQEFLRKLGGVDKISDAASRQALADIYRRTHGVSRSGRGLTYQESRAAAAELATIVRKLADKRVISLEVIGSSNVARTPDLRETRLRDNQISRLDIETFSLTSATRATKPVRGIQAPRKAQPNAELGRAILGKARDTPQERSQIRAGGEIVGNVQFKVFDRLAFVAEADATMFRLSARLQSMPHVKGVELVGIQGEQNSSKAEIRSVLRYERQVDGTYSRVP